MKLDLDIRHEWGKKLISSWWTLSGRRMTTVTSQQTEAQWAGWKQHLQVLCGSTLIHLQQEGLKCDEDMQTPCSFLPAWLFSTFLPDFLLLTDEDPSMCLVDTITSDDKVQKRADNVEMDEHPGLVSTQRVIQWIVNLSTRADLCWVRNLSVSGLCCWLSASNLGG